MDKIKLAVFCFFYTHGKCCHHSGLFVSVWLTVLVAQRNQLKCLLKRSRKSVEVSSKLEKSLRSKVLPKPPRLITMHRAPTGRTSASSASTSCLCFRGNGARQPKRAARGRHDDTPGRSKAAALAPRGRTVRARGLRGRCWRPFNGLQSFKLLWRNGVQQRQPAGDGRDDGRTSRRSGRLRNSTGPALPTRTGKNLAHSIRLIQQPWKSRAVRFQLSSSSFTFEGPHCAGVRGPGVDPGGEHAGGSAEPVGLGDGGQRLLLRGDLPVESPVPVRLSFQQEPLGGGGEYRRDW